VLVLAVLGGRASGAEAARNPELYRHTTQSSAWVIAPQDRKVTLTGTGWLLDPKDRLLITNQHVVGQCTTVSVMFPLYRENTRQLITAREEYTRLLRAGDKTHRGVVLATDSRRDLALIQLDSIPPLPALKLAEGGADRNDRVHFVGNPGDSKQLWVATSGVVVRAGPDLVIEVNTGLQFKARMLTVQTDEPIRPGYSGGPVVNDRGQVVGVSTTLRKAGRRAGCVEVAEVKAFVAEARRLVNPQTAGDFKNAGSYHLDQKRYDRAIEAFSRAIELAPTDPDAYVLRGSAYAKKTAYLTALADYNQALKLNAGYAWAYHNRADLYRLRHKADDYDRSLDDYNQCLKCNPQYALAYFGRSLIYRARGELAKAEEDYRKAVGLAPALADLLPDLPADERDRGGEAVDKYLPDNAGFVLAVNVRQLVTAPAFVRHYRARLERLVKEQERWQVLLAGLAIEPSRDLTRVVIAGPALDGEAPVTLRVLVQGRFDPERFRLLAENAYKVVEVPDGLGGHYRLYELADAARRGPGFFALASPTTVVFSPSRAEVVDALEKGAGWRRTALEDPGVRAGLERTGTAGGLWLVVPGGAGAANLADADPAGVLIQAGDEAKAQEAAGRLGRDVGRLQEVVKSVAARHPELAPLVELVTAVRITAQGGQVLLKAAVPEAPKPERAKPAQPQPPH
jgi:tetratricopeptide (TPR) repeat protein